MASTEHMAEDAIGGLGSAGEGSARGYRRATIDTARLRRSAEIGTGYTRFVQGMRLILPTIAVALVLAVALWPEFSKIEDAVTSTDIAIDLRDAERLTMTSPRYRSRDANGASYTVTADEAEQLQGTTGMIELRNPAADMTMEDGSWVM